MYGILVDTAIQLLFVVAGALALRWYFAASDRAKARRIQAITKILERLDTIAKPLNLERINDGGAAVRFMREKFAAEDRRKLIAMVQMAERAAQGMAAAAKRPQNDYVVQSPNSRAFLREDIAIGGGSQPPQLLKLGRQPTTAFGITVTDGNRSRDGIGILGGVRIPKAQKLD